MSVIAPSLPNDKLFIFGGSYGYFDEGSVRNFGTLSNDLLCITLNNNPDHYSLQIVKLENKTNSPSPRENSILFYD